MGPIIKKAGLATIMDDIKLEHDHHASTKILSHASKSNITIEDPLKGAINIFEANDRVIQKRNLYMLRDFARSMKK